MDPCACRRQSGALTASAIALHGTSRETVSSAAVQCGASGHGWARVGVRTVAHLERVVVLAAVIHVVVYLAHALEEVARLHGASRAGGRRGVARRRCRFDRRGRRRAAAAEQLVADHGARHGAHHRRAHHTHHACQQGEDARRWTGAALATTRVGGSGAYRGQPQPGRPAPQPERQDELPQQRVCVSQSCSGWALRAAVRVVR